jgi:hypothetical protein
MKYTREPTTEATCDLQFTRRGGGAVSACADGA